MRRPPRGVRKQDYASANYFDLWLPELAPSAPLVRFAHSSPFTDQRWAHYVRRYRRELQKPGPRRLLAVLAALSHRTDFAVGCYCEREDRCHRSVLRDVFAEHGALLAPASPG